MAELPVPILELRVVTAAPFLTTVRTDGMTAPSAVARTGIVAKSVAIVVKGICLMMTELFLETAMLHTTTESCIMTHALLVVRAVQLLMVDLLILLLVFHVTAARAAFKYEWMVTASTYPKMHGSR